MWLINSIYWLGAPRNGGTESLFFVTREKREFRGLSSAYIDRFFFYKLCNPKLLVLCLHFKRLQNFRSLYLTSKVYTERKITSRIIITFGNSLRTLEYGLLKKESWLDVAKTTGARASQFLRSARARAHTRAQAYARKSANALRPSALPSLGQLAGEPVESFVESLALSRASGLNVPSAPLDIAQAELLGQFGASHRIGQILLVGEDEKYRVFEFVLLEHFRQLVLGFGGSLPVVAVNDEDEALRVLEVMSPKRSDLVLTADVPDSEGDVLVLDRLDVEADGGNGGDDLAQFELVEDGGFSSGVQTHHQNAHLLLPE